MAMEGVNVAHSYVRSEVRGPRSRSLPPHLARSSPIRYDDRGGQRHILFPLTRRPPPTHPLPPRARETSSAARSPRKSTLTWFTTRCVGWTASRASTSRPTFAAETRTSSSRAPTCTSSPCAASSAVATVPLDEIDQVNSIGAVKDGFFYSYVWGEPKAMAVAKRFDVVRRRGVEPFPKSSAAPRATHDPGPIPRTRTHTRTRDRTTNHDRRVHREAHRVCLFARGVDDGRSREPARSAFPDGRVHRGTHRARLFAFHGGDDRGGDCAERRLLR